MRSNNTNSNNRTKHQPSQYQGKRPSAMAYRLSEMIAPNKEFMLMSSDVAIGITLSHSNVNSTGWCYGICILMELYLCQSLLF